MKSNSKIQPYQTGKDNDLFRELSLLIEQSQQKVAQQVNSAVTLLFWQVGKRINDTILQNKRADYGKKIVPTLSAQLEMAYGHNFTEKNVRRMMQFAEQFPDIEIVVTLSRQLSWSHFLVLIPLKSQEAKLYYAHSSAAQALGVRELLELHKDGIMVAEYWTELPPKKQLEQKIHSLLLEAKERIERNKQLTGR